MANLAEKVLSVGGSVLLAITPAASVSADEIAKEFSKGKKPVVVLQEKQGRGRTAGKGNFSAGLEAGYTSIDTEVTKGEATTSVPAGIPGAPFPNPNAGQTVPIDPRAINDAYGFGTDKSELYFVGAYGLTDWLEIFGKVGAAQSDFNLDGKGGLANSYSDSGKDLAYGFGVTAVPVELEGGLYLALTGELTKGSHKGMPISNNPVGEVDVDWRELIGRIEVGKKFGNWTPYGGVEYSKYKEKRSGRAPGIESTFDIEGKNPWSGFAGVEKQLNKNWSIGANATFGGGKKGFFLNAMGRY